VQNNDRSRQDLKNAMAKGLSWDAQCYDISWDARGVTVGRIAGMRWERKCPNLVPQLLTSSPNLLTPKDQVGGKQSYSDQKP
jgi:hypothetical protein